MTAEERARRREALRQQRIRVLWIRLAQFTQDAESA